MTSATANPTLTRLASIAVLLLAAILLAACKSEAEAETTKIGYIPIADHMLVGFSEALDNETFKHGKVESIRFRNYPTITEALTSGDIDGAFLLAPLAMQLKVQDAPVKIVLLGHRDGSGLVVDKSAGYERIADLEGHTVAIPHRFSTNNFLMHMYAAEQGLSDPDSIDRVEAGPPEMFSALQAKSIDGYITAEPFLSEAEASGVGEVLVFTSEIWNGHPDCVLVLREEFIRQNPEAVQELITSLVRQAISIESDRSAAVPIASKFLGKDEGIMRSALEDRRRVTFNNLVPLIPELQRMQDYMADRMGLFPTKADLNDLVDDRFAKEAYRQLEARDGN